METRTFVARSAALLSGNWLQGGLNFLLLLWLARVDQEGFGLLVFGTAVALTVQALFGLGLDHFTIRQLDANRRHPNVLLGRMIRLKILLGLLVLTGLLFFGWVRQWQIIQLLVVLVIAAAGILDSIAHSFFSVFRFHGRQAREVACSFAASSIAAIYGFTAIFWQLGIAAVACFLLLAAGLKILLALRYWDFATGPGLWGEICRLRHRILPQGQFRALLTIVGTRLLGSLSDDIPVFLLKQYTDLRAVALYGAAKEIAGGVASIVANLVIGGVLYPSFVQEARHPDGLKPRLRLYFWRLALVGLGVTFFFCTLGGDLLVLLYGEAYAEAVRSVQIVGVSTLFSFVNNLVVYALMAERQERRLLTMYLAPAALSPLLGWFLVPLLGATGAALTFLACRIVMTVLIATFAQRRYTILVWADMEPFVQSTAVLGIVYFALMVTNVLGAHLSAVVALLLYSFWATRSSFGGTVFSR